MARADTSYLNLLNLWAEMLWEDGWRFNQVGGQGLRTIPNCQNQPYLQYERQYIANALNEAADKAAEYLGFPIAPRWVTDELVTVNCDLHWSRQTLSARFGNLIEFGRRTVTVIESDAAVAYSDADGDTIDDIATITVTGVSDIDADEIQVFFRPDDGAYSPAHEWWQIEGLKVEKAGNTATITGPRWLFVHPTEVWSKEYTPGTTDKFQGDTTNTGHFVDYVDVYRVYADATNAVQLLLNPAQVGVQNAVVNAAAHITNAYMGEFQAYTADGQSLPAGAPHTVRISYRAGAPLVNGRVDTQLAQAVIRYANTLMPQCPQMCDRGLAMWNGDNKVDGESLAARDTWTPPPFGITLGGLFAWSVISARRNTLKGRSAKREA